MPDVLANNSERHRRKRGRPRSALAPAAVTLDIRSAEANQWTDEVMKAAMEDVISGKS